MSNRMKIKNPTTKNKVVNVETKEISKDTSQKNSFFASKKAKGNKPNSFTGKSSKVFSKKKT